MEDNRGMDYTSDSKATGGTTYILPEAGLVFKYYTKGNAKATNEKHKMLSKLGLPVPTHCETDDESHLYATCYAGWSIAQKPIVEGMSAKLVWLKNLSKTVVVFAQKGFIQTDPNANNFLVDNDDKVAMVDIDSLRRIDEHPPTFTFRGSHDNP